MTLPLGGYTRLSVPKPRALGAPSAPGMPFTKAPPRPSVVNLTPNPGPRETDPNDPIADLINRVTAQIKSQRSAANVDVQSVINMVKQFGSNWKPPVIN